MRFHVEARRCLAQQGCRGLLGLIIGRACRRRFKTAISPLAVAASHIGVPERRETSLSSPSSQGQRDGRQSGLRCGAAESRCYCGRLIRCACILVDTRADGL
jgi:hypothetical protein